jgi:TnpA family transposase
MARINILNLSEQIIFEEPPIFNSIERKRYLNVTQQLELIIDGLKTPTNKVCFVVVFGYFKARHKFFARKFHATDIDYAAQQLEFSTEDIRLNTYSRDRYRHHQELILNHFGFAPFDSIAKEFVKVEISQLVKVQFRAKIVLLEIVQLLTRKRIEIPSYNVLATLIANAINYYQDELNQIIEKNLNSDQKNILEALLKKVTGSGSDDKWRYQITRLKNPSQSVTPAKIKENVTNMRELLGYYLKISPILTKLELNHECLRFYATSFIKSQIHQVLRRKESSRYLYLIAFIACQTLKIQDMLIDTMLFAVQSAKNTTEKHDKDSYYHGREIREQSITKLIDAVQKEFVDTVVSIKSILANQDLTAEQKVLAIDVVLNKSEDKESDQDQFTTLKDELSKSQQNNSYYDLLEERSLKLQNRVADIVRYTIFDPTCGNLSLLKALEYYQEKLGNIDKNAPLEFMSPEQRNVIFVDNKFRVSLYKALLYITTANSIKSGVLNMVYSEKYRSLEDYLIPKELWEKNRDEYLQRAELTEYADCEKTLNFLDDALHARYEETNQSITSGNNPFLTFKTDGSFHVTTPKLDDTDTIPLSGIFPEQKFISLLEALVTVDSDTDFLEEFQHWQVKFQQEKPAKKVFFAGIMAYGCDIGQHKFAQISKQINENELNNTLNWYFTLPNILAANDKILLRMEQLELPNINRESGDLLHTSSDGQKFGVSVDSLNANYAFKYLGKDKGVSVMTFIDMRQMMWYSTVVSSAEREAAYVVDGLMYNNVIKSDIHSTDTHGYSELIFGVLPLLRFAFAPRIKGLGRQTLYAFPSRKDYFGKSQQGFKPDKYIRKELITPEWDAILRFVATIKLKFATASQLFRRLNSYANQHPLYRALKEFGKIHKTLFILQYVDDIEFRQSIEKQLNKVEGSHKLAKAIALGNDHAFLQGNKEDQEIAEGCRRLIKNVLIYWNYLYLSNEIAKEKNEERKLLLIESLQGGSIMRWSHFNLAGEYDFSDEKMVDSIGLKSPTKPLKKDT